MKRKQSYRLREVAARWSASYSQVLELVTTGQLPAIDISTKASGRRRYVVTEESLLAFEQSRSQRHKASPSRPQRRKAVAANLAPREYIS